MAAAWRPAVPGFMVVVLGFFFREDEDVPDADLSSSSRSDEFRKAPTANGTVHLLPGVPRFGWYSVARIHAFIPTVWFRRERREALL
jgi:predicted NUDIX family NTP pyrophosphohydrolase